MVDRQGLVRGRMQVMVPCWGAVLHGSRLAALAEGRRGGLHAIPSLRRHDPDRFRRSAPSWRPLSPQRPVGSRVVVF